MDVRQEYFEWLYGIVCSGQSKSYYYLLDQLFNTEFQYSNPMDGNRVADGVELRYIWGRESGYADYIIANTIDNCVCSVLEVMVALSVRCEETIMSDPNYGDRTPKWIWVMLKNLGLDSMDDNHYDEAAVIFALEKWMKREYEYNGSGGGIFVLRNPRADLRDTEIWYQAMWYLTERYERRY